MRSSSEAAILKRNPAPSKALQPTAHAVVLGVAIAAVTTRPFIVYGSVEEQTLEETGLGQGGVETAAQGRCEQGGAGATTA